MKARSTVFLLIAGGLTLFAFSPPRPYLIGYGIAAILIALFVGWIAAVAFRKA